MTRRALVVDDNPDDAMLMRRYLDAHSGEKWQVRHVATEAEMESALSESWDVIIGDYMIPEFRWPKPYILAQLRQPHTPFVVVSGVFGDELALAAKSAFTRGVDAYLPKTDLDRLGETVDLAILSVRASHRVDQAAEALQRKIGTGPLKKD